MHRHTVRLVLLSLPLMIAACRDNKVDAYRVPKEKDFTMPGATAASAPAAAPASAPASAPAATPGGMSGMPGMAGAPVAVAAGINLTWTAPAHWQAKEGSAMRKGTYSISGDAGATAELAITAFPGAVGGEFANVNRWRGQLSLPAISEGELATAVTHLTTNDLTISFVDLVSTDAAPQRMLGAMVPFQGAVWFFKLLGPDALVAKEKAAFVEFLKTIKSTAPTAP
jgi:hypothetical protein